MNVTVSKEKTYVFDAIPKRQKQIGRIFYSFVFVIFTTGSTYALIRGLVGFASSLSNNEGLSDAIYFILISMFMFYSIIQLLTQLILPRSDIKLKNDVIYVQTLFGLWCKVPTNEIATIITDGVTYLSVSRPRKSISAVAIQVSYLSIFHRLMGLVHGLGNTPIFIVTPDHRNHQELIDYLHEVSTS